MNEILMETVLDELFGENYCIVLGSFSKIFSMLFY